jgi:hypothetical protein
MDARPEGTTAGVSPEGITVTGVSLPDVRADRRVPILSESTSSSSRHVYRARFARVERS